MIKLLLIEKFASEPVFISIHYVYQQYSMELSLYF